MFSSTYHRASITEKSGSMFNGQSFKTYGAILAIFAAAALSISVANVALTSQAYCDPWTDASPVYCSNTNEPYVWTWVASGIWASLPIFLSGLFAMALGKNPQAWTRWFTLLTVLSTIVFAPAMLILSAVEVWRGSASRWNFYKMDSSLAEGNILIEDSPYQAKFALPLVIAILAGIMFVMTGLITLSICCCMKNLGLSMSEPAATASKQIYQPASAEPQTQEVYCPPRAQISSSGDYQPSTGPYLATRYNSVSEHSNSSFGNFNSKRGLSS